MAQFSRLGASAIPRPLYPSFAGKTEAPVVRAQYSRLGVSAIPRPLYNTFAGKSEADVTGGWFPRRRRRR